MKLPLRRGWRAGLRMQSTRMEEEWAFWWHTCIQILAGRAHLKAFAAMGVIDGLFQEPPKRRRSAQLFAVAVDHQTLPLDRPSPPLQTQAPLARLSAPRLISN